MAAQPGASGPETKRSQAAPNGNRGLLELARLALEDGVRLIQQEIDLAKIEIREMIASNFKAALLLGAAGFCALLFVIFGLITIALIFPLHWLAAAIEALVFLGLAVVLGLVGRRRLMIGPPPKTMTSLKEDAEWARQLLKRNGK